MGAITGLTSRPFVPLRSLQLTAGRSDGRSKPPGVVLMIYGGRERDFKDKDRVRDLG